LAEIVRSLRDVKGSSHGAESNGQCGKDFHNLEGEYDEFSRGQAYGFQWWFLEYVVSHLRWVTYDFCCCRPRCSCRGSSWHGAGMLRGGRVRGSRFSDRVLWVSLSL
jgi:hypothetical protein